MSGGFGYDLIRQAREARDSGNVEAFTGAVAPFDPADNKVDDVIAYARANPDKAEAILAAERDGKNRSTIIDALS